jgi:hypothetical protein
VANYDTLKKHQAALIRKSLKGSFFLAPDTAPAIAALTSYTAGPPAVISLTALPTGWEDLGLLSNDGVSASNNVSSSDVSSWGYTTPTRSDVTADTTTLTVVAQETKLLTIGLYTGQDMSTVVPAVNTGEVAISKPQRPASRYYRGLLLAVDESNEGEVFIGRYFPKIKVTGKSDQSFGGGDDPVSWGVTLQTYMDDAAGYSERWLFGGTGWQADLVEMGFTP